MSENEARVRNFIAPMKLMYHPRGTDEYAERAYHQVHVLSNYVLELTTTIRMLQDKISKLEDKTKTI